MIIYFRINNLIRKIDQVFNPKSIYRQDVRSSNDEYVTVHHSQLHAFCHYIIYSFTQNIIVANMSLLSEIIEPL